MRRHLLSLPLLVARTVVRKCPVWGQGPSLHNRKYQYPEGFGILVCRGTVHSRLCLVWAALFLLILSCSRTSPGLTDAKFADVFAAVLRLQHLYQEKPDTLMSKRVAVYRQYGVSESDLDQFITQRSKNPQKWEETLRILHSRLELDSTFVNRREELEGLIKGRMYQANPK